MFEDINSDGLFVRRRSVLGWVSAALVVLGGYFLFFTHHSFFALVCPTTAGLLLVIDGNLRKKVEIPHIQIR
jgi:hypothetical protein